MPKHLRIVCPQCGEPLNTHEERQQNACTGCFEDFIQVEDATILKPEINEYDTPINDEIHD